MDYNKQAVALLDKGDALAALIAYTKALIEHPTSPDYYSNRSKAFARVSPPRHDLALQDAEYAVVNARARGKRDKIQEGQVRRVVALYNTGQYAAADKLIELLSVDKDAKDKEAKALNIWKLKVKQKLAALPDSEKQDAEIEQFPKIKLPTPEALKKLLKRQINSDGIFNFDAAEGKVDVSIEQTAEKPVHQQEQQETKLATAVVVRQDWFQTPTTVTITLFAKGVNKDSFESEIKEDSVYISFPNPGNTTSEYSYSIDPSYGAIDIEKSKATVLKTKVEILLTKATPGQKWNALDGIEKPATSTTDTQTTVTLPLPKETAPAYPTSSRKGAKNWDKVAADLTKADKPAKKSTKKVTNSNGSESSAEEEEVNDGGDSDIEGGDDVDNFFKKLYKGSDPDTQRAMMKSYYESGGTTLSTNWDEVGSKRVEPYKSRDED